MAQKEKLDDIDTLFIEAETVKQLKKAHKRTVGKKTIKVQSSLEIAAENLKQAKKVHKAEIKRLKRIIRSHKLLMVQAKNTFKLVKLSK